MSPGNDRGAPRQESAALIIESAAPSITADTDNMRNVVLDAVLRLGPDELYAASLGYRLGRLDAEQIARRMIADAGRDVALSPEWRATSRQPRWVEVQRRRGECAGRHRLDRCTCGESDVR